MQPEFEAMEIQRSEERESDRERSYVVKEMMGDAYSTYFHEDEPEPDPDEDRTLERDNNDLTDAKRGL